MEALTYKQLSTNLEEIADIYDFEIVNEVNEHATMKLTGILKNEAGQSFALKLRNNASIQIFYEMKGSKRWFFCGTITKSKVIFETDVYTVHIEAKSNTYLLDIHKKSRSFQNLNLKTHQLVQSVLSEYENLVLNIEVPNRPINQMLIQYNETDYQFVKRIASIFNQGILPNVQSPGIACSLGVRDRRSSREIKLRNLAMSCDLERFGYMRKNFIPNLRESDNLIQSGSSYEIFTLGEAVELNSTSQIISRAVYSLSDGLLEGNYSVQPINGLQQKRIYNNALSGTSHTGTVLSAQRDQVKVHLDMDVTQDSETAMLLPYSTVAASKDGSGWYFMPQPSDQVRVYLPTDDENIAFAISSVSAYVPTSVMATSTSNGVNEMNEEDTDEERQQHHQAGQQQVQEAASQQQAQEPQQGTDDRMGDPNVRYIRSSANQEVKFTPEGIIISSADTQAKISLLNDGSVIIFGQQSISMTATEDISIRAEKELLINAKESIKIECEKNSSIELDSSGNTTLTGFEIKSN